MTDTSEAPAVQLRPAKMRAVAQLVAWARNARTHSEEQIAVIAASITEFGWTNPVLVDGNQILAGHGRVLAAVSLGLEKIPCINLGGLSDIQKRAYVVADNRIAELAVWDENLLMAELVALDDDMGKHTRPPRTAGGSPAASGRGHEEAPGRRGRDRHGRRRSATTRRGRPRPPSGCG